MKPKIDRASKANLRPFEMLSKVCPSSAIRGPHVLFSNNKGLILLTVLGMVIVMTILAISILNINMNQVISTEDQIKQIKGEIMAKGLLSYIFASQQSGAPTNNVSENHNLDGITYGASAVLDNTDAGINQTNILNVKINY